MDWINNFIIPLVKAIFIMAFVLSMIYIVYKSIRIIWSRWLRHFIKYRILGYKVKDSELIKQLSNVKDWEIRKTFLIQGYKLIKINELLYLKKLLGGKQNGRSTKRNDRQVEEKPRNKR